MARQASVSISNTASQGLITEATGLNFPENAWTDALNVVPDNKGVTSRRKGINYEIDATTHPITRTSGETITTGRWPSVAGIGTLNFVIVQIGSLLYFYDEVLGEPLSTNIKSFTIDLDDHVVSGAPSVATVDCEFASGKGYLFITHPYCNPFYVAYDPDTDTITATSITIQARDFEGVDDGLEPEEKPTSLTDAHEYNLANQGWYEDVKDASAGVVDPIVRYNTVVSAYPPNSLQWWALKNTVEEFAPGTNDLWRAFPGNSLAPKGHFILDWFDTDRSGATSRIGTVTERTAGYNRPSACAFFAGRVWYAGVNSSGYADEVYFSQIIERDTQFGYCYQANDPTAEQYSDLLATDGGIIKILDVGKIYKLFATQKALIVFASNGIWSISGTDVTPFKATDYSITKVSGVRAISSTSFVDVQGFPVWWNQEGIYIVRSDELANFKLDSLTDTTIKTFFQDIPNEAKLHVRGAYNPIDNIIQWVYNSDHAASGIDILNFDSILSLNIQAGAFYPWTVDQTEDVFINSIVTTASIAGESVGGYDNVIDAALDNVIDGSTNQVVVYNVTGGITESYGLKYLVSREISGSNYEMTFAEEYDTLNRDWSSLGAGVSYNSYYTAGYMLKGDAQRFGQENYLVVYANRPTGASAFVQIIWDYGKVTGTANQIYRNVGSLGIIQARIMLRGRGRVFQFKVTSDDDAPFEIIGWSAFETQNSTI